MPPLITLNRSLPCSSWMRFKDQTERVLFKYKVLLESSWGRWLSWAGRMRSWVCSSVWIPAVLTRWSCLQPAQSVRVPAAMCVLLGFKYSGRQQKASGRHMWLLLDKTSPRNPCLWSTQVIGHDSPKTVSHTHILFPSELFLSVQLYKYLTHMLLGLYIPLTSLGICGR